MISFLLHVRLNNYIKLGENEAILNNDICNSANRVWGLNHTKDKQIDCQAEDSFGTGDLFRTFFDLQMMADGQNFLMERLQ